MNTMTKNGSLWETMRKPVNIGKLSMGVLFAYLILAQSASAKK